MSDVTMQKHFERVRSELRDSGVTPYGMKKNEARHLHEIIHQDEHIQGVAYGRYKNGSAMLIATDKRVLFFDKKPFFKTTDEITYDVISGIQVGKQGPFSSLTLHTRIGDYMLSYINLASAVQFRHYIEAHRLELPVRVYPPEPIEQVPTPAVPTLTGTLVTLGAKAKVFLKANEVGTLSSTSKTGSVHGSVVYYTCTENDDVYLLTKSGTQHAKNIATNPQVALTLFDATELKTLQLEGIMTLETDKDTKQFVFSQIVKPRNYGNDKRLPPVVQLKGDKFIVLKLNITFAKFTSFKDLA